MKTIIHLSDLHFGKVDNKRVPPILELIKKIDPDIVVISGDLTQRAKEKEFVEAKNFLKDIGKPIFVVPGNHDIPLYNIFRRFATPFKRYFKFISNHLSPIYRDNDIAIIGINSVRRFTVSSGRISKKQIEEAEKYFMHIDGNIVKIVVCHHPFDMPLKGIKGRAHKIVAHSEYAINKLSKHNVDIFLSGHLHLQHVGDTTIRYKIKGYNALIVQAGTAISIRRRGEPVSFNVIRIDAQKIDIDTYCGDEKLDGYNLTLTEKFEKTETGWKKM